MLPPGASGQAVRRSKRAWLRKVSQTVAWGYTVALVAFLISFLVRDLLNNWLIGISDRGLIIFLPATLLLNRVCRAYCFLSMSSYFPLFGPHPWSTASDDVAPAPSLPCDPRRCGRGERFTWTPPRVCNECQYLFNRCIIVAQK